MLIFVSFIKASICSKTKMLKCQCFSVNTSLLCVGVVVELALRVVGDKDRRGLRKYHLTQNKFRI